MQLTAQFLLSMLGPVSGIVVGGAVACLPVRIHNIAIYIKGRNNLSPLAFCISSPLPPPEPVRCAPLTALAGIKRRARRIFPGFDRGRESSQ